MRWETNSPHNLSMLCCLEKVNPKAIGCIKLLNGRIKKPSETAMLAVPPAYASLKTSPSGDRVLVLSVHTAMLQEVQPPP